jgi:hypothetical protein
MTQDGLPAAVAATYLGQTIGQLAAPLPKARKEMEGLGIDATKLSQTITSGSGHGLVDAIKMLYDGITQHLTPSGLVAVDTFKKSKGAAADFQTMLLKLPPNMQTAYQALATMAGGVKGMQGVLLLGGTHLNQFAGNVKAMAAQVKKGGNDVAGYAEQQKTLNGKLDDAKASWSALMVTMGNYFLPIAKQVLDWFNGSMPSIERWTNQVAQWLVPAIKDFGNYFSSELWPALQKGYNTILPGIIQAWGILTGGVKDSGVKWKNVGDFIALGLIPTLATFTRVTLPAVAAILRVVIQAITNMMEEANALAKVIVDISVPILHAFADMARGIGLFVLGLSSIPGFGWAKDAAMKMLGAATAADNLANSLFKIKSPPPIDIQVNAYGTSAIANAIISGNAPLANSMITANSYAAGGAYSTVVSGSQRTNGGMRAAGGPVKAGMRYRVGENGPEDFTAPADGYVHDAKSSKSGGNGPAVWIDKYYANDKPITQISADLMFRMQHA